MPDEPRRYHVLSVNLREEAPNQQSGYGYPQPKVMTVVREALRVELSPEQWEAVRRAIVESSKW